MAVNYSACTVNYSACAAKVLVVTTLHVIFMHPVERAEGLPGLDTCAILEVGNAAVRTQTVYRRTANPEWNKTFCL